MTTAAHKISTPIFRRLYWLPVAATACMLDCCYIPGNLGISQIGLGVWAIFMLFWIPHCIMLRAFRFRELPVWVLLLVSILCLNKIPIGLGLYFSESAFDKFLAQQNLKLQKPLTPLTPLTSNHSPVTLGLYKITDYAIDEDGGVYLFTKHDRFQDGSSESSAGFAFRPSAKNALVRRKYCLCHLSPLKGDWYTFETLNFW